MPDPWSIERCESAAFARCNALDVAGIAHAFGLRDHDAGPAVSPDPKFAAARRSLARLAGCADGAERPLRQVHGSKVVRATDVGPGGVEADAVWERARAIAGGWVAVRTADCVPILLTDRAGAYLAAVHAGWRGTARGIAGIAVSVLAGAGCDPRSLIAAVGPSIGPCCYPVSADVAASVADACGVAIDAIGRERDGRIRLDLREANRRQLLAAGLAESSVPVAPWCTACEPQWFFSHRRDGAAAGRQLSLIGPRAARS